MILDDMFSKSPALCLNSNISCLKGPSQTYRRGRGFCIRKTPFNENTDLREDILGNRFLLGTGRSFGHVFRSILNAALRRIGLCTLYWQCLDGNG